MSYYYIDIYPKNSDKFPASKIKLTSKLTKLLGKDVQWDINDDKITIGCNREYLDLGVAVSDDMQESLIDDDIKSLYEWAKQDNIIITSDSRNDSNFDFGPKDEKEFFEMIEDRSLSSKSIEGIKTLLSAIKEYDHNTYCWDYILLKGKRFFVLCDSYQPLEDLSFIWIIQVLPNGDLGKEIRLKKIDELTHIEIDDYIYVVDINSSGESEVTIYDLDLNKYASYYECGCMTDVIIDRYSHNNLIEFSDYTNNCVLKQIDINGNVLFEI